MKNILFVILLGLSAFTAKAQQIDTTCKCAIAVRLQPFKVKYNDTAEAKWITSHITFDNLVSRAIFYYAILDEHCQQLLEGNTEMGDKTYSDWDGSSEEAFYYIVNKLQLTPYIKE